MKFLTISSLKERKTSDLLVLPFWEKEKGGVTPAAPLQSLEAALQAQIPLALFKAAVGEVSVIYHDGIEKHVALLGLGKEKEASAEKLRRAFGALTRFCHTKKLSHIHVLVPHASSEMIYGALEGMLLRNYLFFQKETSLKKNPHVSLERVGLISEDLELPKLCQKAVAIFKGVNAARDLVNGNADDVTPQRLAEFALDLVLHYPSLQVEVFDKARIEKEKMTLLLAVNKGSNREPTFTRISYQGDKKSQDHTVIIGKGVTYDTGGLNLKPTGSMETMKSDMAGAAAVLGAIMAVAELKLKTNVTILIPSTENAISSTSYKPGDVYPSLGGPTVEVDNTDAEGRLILADAIAWAVKHLAPSRIIDLATLTGAVLIALGDEVIGLMSNNDMLSKQLEVAGQETYERVWRLPIFDEYREQLNSDIADIKNSGGRLAGSITGSLFLKEFVGDHPWAHLDIAGTAYYSKEKRCYYAQHASGIGVRLLVQFLQDLKK